MRQGKVEDRGRVGEEKGKITWRLGKAEDRGRVVEDRKQNYMEAGKSRG